MIMCYVFALLAILGTAFSGDSFFLLFMIVSFVILDGKITALEDYAHFLEEKIKRIK